METQSHEPGIFISAWGPVTRGQRVHLAGLSLECGVSPQTVSTLNALASFHRVLVLPLLLPAGCVVTRSHVAG